MQDVNTPPSSEQAKVEPLAEEEKMNVALVWIVVRSGPEVMVVSGAVDVKTAVHVWLAGVGSTLPEISTDLTSKICDPVATVIITGETQGLNVPASSLHWKVTDPTLSLPLKWNVAFALRLGCAGPCRIRVSGGIGSGGASPPVHSTL